MSDPIAAVTEREARGEIADLYQDIRVTLGAPVVNLIWRHLATVEGGLRWAWDAVKPLYVDGSVAGQARALVGSLTLPRLPRLPAEVLTSLGIGETERIQIGRVLAAYDRTNPMNWLALSALTGAGPASACPPRDDDEDRALPTADDTPPTANTALAPLEPLPPLLDATAMPPHVAALVARLNGLGALDPRVLQASMYRHLAHWPGLLALTWSLLEPLHADGRLREAAMGVERSARVRLATLASRAAASRPHPAAQAALADFLARIELPRMIAITAMLRGIWPGGPH